MTDANREGPTEGPLNPALKKTTETVYDTERVTPAPIDTTSAKEGGGEGWPVIWLIVVAICVALAIYFVI